jgi:hypothetical protein
MSKKAKEYVDDKDMWVLGIMIVVVFAVFMFAFFMPQPKQDLSCYDLIIKAQGGMAQIWRANSTGIIFCQKQILSGNCVCKFSLNNGTVIYTTEDLMPKWRYYEKDGDK